MIIDTRDLQRAFGELTKEDFKSHMLSIKKERPTDPKPVMKPKESFVVKIEPGVASLIRTKCSREVAFDTGHNNPSAANKFARTWFDIDSMHTGSISGDPMVALDYEKHKDAIEELFRKYEEEEKTYDAVPKDEFNVEINAPYVFVFYPTAFGIEVEMHCVYDIADDIELKEDREAIVSTTIIIESASISTLYDEEGNIKPPYEEGQGSTEVDFVPTRDVKAVLFQYKMDFAIRESINRSFTVANISATQIDVDKLDGTTLDMAKKEASRDVHVGVYNKLLPNHEDFPKIESKVFAPWVDHICGVDPLGNSLSIIPLEGEGVSVTPGLAYFSAYTGKQVTVSWIIGDIEYPFKIQLKPAKVKFDTIVDSEEWTNYGPNRPEEVGAKGDPDANSIFSWSGRKSTLARLFTLAASGRE